MPCRRGWELVALFVAALSIGSGTSFAMEDRSGGSVADRRPDGGVAAESADRRKVPNGRHGTGNELPLPLMDQLSERAISNPRKVDFIAAVLPLIIDANVEILKRRRRIEILALRHETDIALDPEDRRWLARIAERYDTEPTEFATLLRRVDIVPPSLALAQAAEESGWGRSRFALFGNALFGQRVWSDGGMIPLARRGGENFAVRAFASVVEAIRSYMHNLNTHFAYHEFRQRRAAMRRHRARLDAFWLTGALTNYSERREAYLDSIRSIISFNRLDVFDQILVGPELARPDA